MTRSLKLTVFDGIKEVSCHFIQIHFYLSPIHPIRRVYSSCKKTYLEVLWKIMLYELALRLRTNRLVVPTIVPIETYLVLIPTWILLNDDLHAEYSNTLQLFVNYQYNN